MYGLYVTSMTDDLVLQQVHDDWKQKGFPYYPKDRKWRDNIFNKLIKSHLHTDYHGILNGYHQ